MRMARHQAYQGILGEALSAVAMRGLWRGRWTGVLQEVATMARRRILERSRVRQKAAADEVEKRRVQASLELWEEEEKLLQYKPGQMRDPFGGDSSCSKAQVGRRGAMAEEERAEAKGRRSEEVCCGLGFDECRVRLELYQCSVLKISLEGCGEWVVGDGEWVVEVEGMGGGGGYGRKSGMMRAWRRRAIRGMVECAGD